MTFPRIPVMLFCGIIGSAIFGTSTPAAAFVQTMTCYPSGQYQCRPDETPKPVLWSKRTIHYHINERGSRDIHDGQISDGLRDNIISSFNTWSEPKCTDLELAFDGLTSQKTIGWDNTDTESNLNVVVWRDDEWPYGGFSAIALTTVTFSSSTGFIVDADIEMNGEMYTFTDTDDPGQTIIDVRNTMTHEVGHFIGLDHSSHPESTMYSTAPPGELSKRVLSPMDVEGVCHIYPDGVDPPIDPSPTGRKLEKGGCCAAAPNKSPASPPIIGCFLLTFGAIIWRRSRNRKVL